MAAVLINIPVKNTTGSYLRIDQQYRASQVELQQPYPLKQTAK